jgi:gliding motility-associatede transport system auxiliary component
MQKLRQNSDFILALGLIGVSVPLIVYLIRHQFNIFGQVIFVIGFICLGLYVGLEWPRILNTLGGRQVRYGGNSLLMSLLFIGIVAFVVFLSQRYFKRIDLTADKSFSISQQTVKVVDNLSRSVKIWAFYGPYDNSADAETLLKSYQQAGGGKISYEFIDPDSRPTVARQYGLQQGESGIMVLETTDRTQKVTGSTESDITSALLKLSSDTPKVIYLLSGHGERSPDDTSESGTLLAKQALEKDNYTIKTLNLITSSGTTVTSTTNMTLTTGTRQFGTIPADASAIIIFAPQTPIGDGEWQILSQWLNNGGKLYLLMDALDGPSGLEDMLLANWGIAVRDDLVVDTVNSLMGDVATLVILRDSANPITRNLPTQAYLPGARSILLPQDADANSTYTVLAKSSEQSWSETGISNLTSGVRYDAGKDVLGPVDVAVSVERSAPDGAKARLVIYGNARFATDAYLNSGGNLEFFINAVNWLTEDEQLISIRARDTVDRTLYIPSADARLIAFGVALGLPLLVLALGALVWWRRR